ncbi:MAG: hypothetical protein IPO62_14885 [Saprospiraceae bacterium]|nr:hypothetical protein [Saprospiraceae bacterium]
MGKEIKMLEKFILTIEDELLKNGLNLLSIDSNYRFYYKELNENKLVLSISSRLLRTPEFEIGYSAC